MGSPGLREETALSLCFSEWSPLSDSVLSSWQVLFVHITKASCILIQHVGTSSKTEAELHSCFLPEVTVSFLVLSEIPD